MARLPLSCAPAPGASAEHASTPARRPVECTRRPHNGRASVHAAISARSPRQTVHSTSPRLRPCDHRRWTLSISGCRWSHRSCGQPTSRPPVARRPTIHCPTAAAIDPSFRACDLRQVLLKSAHPRADRWPLLLLLLPTASYWFAIIFACGGRCGASCDGRHTDATRSAAGMMINRVCESAIGALVFGWWADCGWFIVCACRDPLVGVVCVCVCVVIGGVAVLRSLWMLCVRLCLRLRRRHFPPSFRREEFYGCVKSGVHTSRRRSTFRAHTQKN